MTKIIVLSREKLENFAYEPVHSYAIISITDPSRQRVETNIPNNVITHCTLELQFHDLDEDFGEYYAMTQDQANLVADLVRVWWNYYDFIIVQCEAGVSRSAGIAAAISKWATGSDMEYFNSWRYVPNMRCYKMVLNALMEEESK